MSNRWSALLIGVTLLLSACAAPGKQGTPVPPAASPEPTQATAKVPPWLAMKNTTRINTADPFQAAVTVSQSIWPSTHADNRPGGLILVDPTDWHTAAVMANFIHFPMNGPVLFVNKDGIPPVTADEIKRIKSAPGQAGANPTVLMAGNLDARVEQTIRALGFAPEWIRADNPAALASIVDERYAQLSGSVPQSVVVGSMESPDYTIPAVNWIAHMPDPLLFVGKDEIPEATKQALQRRQGKANIYLLGPEVVVSSAVERALSTYGKVTRVSGKDPFDQAVAFARFSDPATKFGWGITTPGHNLSFVPAGATALAVAAAPFSHLGKHAPMVWTEKDAVPAVVAEYLQSLRPAFKLTPSEGPFNHAWVTGDETVLTRQAQGLLDELLEIVPESASPKGGHGGH